MPSNPPSPAAPRKRSKRLRKLSSDNISIEELLPDDMGYDADVEVLRPDGYEEPESESDDAPMANEQWRSVDEELAARMHRLGQEQTLEPLPASLSERGRKRKSKAMEDADRVWSAARSPDLEVHELVDTADRPSPAKRSRRRSRRPNAAQHILGAHADMWTDSSEKAESKERGRDCVSSSPTTASDQQAFQHGDDEAMDIS